MRSAASLWEDGQLAILPSVGYPNPNRSREVSMAIWQTCQVAEESQRSHGWLGLSMDEVERDSKGAPGLLMVGDRERPIAIQGRKSVHSSIRNLDGYSVADDLKESTKIQKQWVGDSRADELTTFLTRSQTDAFSMADSIKEVTGKVDKAARYPDTKLGQNLKTIASLIKAGFGTRIYYAIQSGYDPLDSTKSRRGSVGYRIVPPTIGRLKLVASRSTVSFVPGSGQSVKSRSLEKIIKPIC